MAKKRVNSEDDIRKRKDGRWEGCYTADHYSKTVKQMFKNVLDKTQAEVKEKLKRSLSRTRRSLSVGRASVHRQRMDGRVEQADNQPKWVSAKTLRNINHVI